MTTGRAPCIPTRTELEMILLTACKVALRQLEYDGDDKTAFHGAPGTR